MLVHSGHNGHDATARLKQQPSSHQQYPYPSSLMQQPPFFASGGGGDGSSGGGGGGVPMDVSWPMSMAAAVVPSVMTSYPPLPSSAAMAPLALGTPTNSGLTPHHKASHPPPSARTEPIKWSAISVTSKSSTTTAQFQVPSWYTASKDYCLLGEGATGVVASVRSAQIGAQYTLAMKRIKAPYTTYAANAFKEVFLMSRLRHPNIVKLVEVVPPKPPSSSSSSSSRHQLPQHLYLVMERVDRSLAQALQTPENRRGMTDTHYRFIMYQLLNALAFMHARGVVHRDVTPSNVLVYADCVVKLADFGISSCLFAANEDSVASAAATTEDTKMSGTSGTSGPSGSPTMSPTTFSPTIQPMTDYVVTRWYRAPELLGHHRLSDDKGHVNRHVSGEAFPYDGKIDVWAAACVWAEMLSKKPMMATDNAGQQMCRIVKTLGNHCEFSLDTLCGVEQYPTMTAILKNAGLGKSTATTTTNTKSSGVGGGGDKKSSWNTLFPPETDPLAVDLLSRMLQIDPARRITAADAVCHPYFDHCRKPSLEAKSFVRSQCPLPPIVFPTVHSTSAWTGVLLSELADSQPTFGPLARRWYEARNHRLRRSTEAAAIAAIATAASSSALPAAAAAAVLTKPVKG